MIVLCMNCFGQKSTSQDGAEHRCLNCGEYMEIYQNREDMVESIKDTKFVLRERFTGINTYSASEFVWSEVEILRKKGHQTFTIANQMKNSPLTKMEIGTQFIELANQNILKKVA